MRACSRRASLSRWDSTFERSEATSGVREARREDWADWSVGSARSSKCWVMLALEVIQTKRIRFINGHDSGDNKLDRQRCQHTRVVCNTFARRGKSLTPESRIDMLEDRSAFVERRDETQDASGFAML